MDIGETEEVIYTASRLVKLSLKSKDALHLACAMITKCDYFLTTDDSVIKKSANIKEIRVINPVGFLMEIEE